MSDTHYTPHLMRPVCTSAWNIDNEQEIVLVGMNFDNRTQSGSINIEKCLQRIINNQDTSVTCNWYSDSQSSTIVPETVVQGELITLNGVPTMFGGRHLNGSIIDR